MLPASYATPVAVILTLGGFIACFAGYRLFRIVLGLYGFFIGASYTSSLMAPSSTWTLVLAAVVGGIVGAGLMYAAYFLGVGLVGAGLGVLALNAGWSYLAASPEPPTWLVVVVAVIGALGALSVARYVVVIGTALAGSWTLIVGVLALMGDPTAVKATSAGNVWVLYPLEPIAARWWTPIAWIALAIVGAIVQLQTTKKSLARVPRGK